MLIARRRALPVQPIALREPTLMGAKSGAWLGLARHHPQAPTRGVAGGHGSLSAQPLQDAPVRRLETPHGA